MFLYTNISKTTIIIQNENNFLTCDMILYQFILNDKELNIENQYKQFVR